MTLKIIIVYFADTLLALYPGEYVIGSALFLLTLFLLKRDIEYIKKHLSNKEKNGGGPNVEVVTMDKKQPQSQEPEKEQTKL